MVELTIPSSGRVLTIRPQPLAAFHALQATARKRIAADRPQPPVQRVAVGPDEWREVANESHPDYLRAIQDHETRYRRVLQELLTDVTIRAGIVLDLEALAPELAELRQRYDGLLDLPDDDRDLALYWLLAPEAGDWQAILAEVWGRALPSDQQVAFRRSLLRSSLAGPGSGDHPANGGAGEL